MRKSLGFNDLYEYHIAKYNDLINVSKNNIKISEERVEYLKHLCLQNKEFYEKYLLFDITAHINNDNVISTKSKCDTSKINQAKRYTKALKVYKKDSDILGIILYLHKSLMSLYDERIKSFIETNNITLYESYLIDKYTFKEIYLDWLKKTEELLLEGHDIKLPSDMGTIGFYRIVNNYNNDTSKANSYISWGSTMKQKKLIVNNGGTLYNKEDHEKAIERGEEYDGQKYIVFKSDLFSYSFQWFSSKIKNAKRYNIVIGYNNHSKKKDGKMITTDEYYEQLKDNCNIHDIVNLPISIKSKVYMYCRLFPHMTIRFAKDISHNKYLQQLNNNYMSKDLSKQDYWEYEKYKDYDRNS